MRLSDFDYHLQQERIAQHPVEPRDSSRLMLVSRDGRFEHRRFHDFPSFLNPGDVLVLNDTRVIPARLIGHRSSGAKIEVLLVHPLSENIWRCMVNPGRKVRPGDTIVFSDELSGEVVKRTEGGTRAIRFIHEGELEELLQHTGQTPLPPYIRRKEPEEGDRERYQTVYAEKAGAVAAPTAGLHFTEEVLGRIRSHGIDIARLTLHVGPGTFQPVKVDEIDKHRMDSEWYEVSDEAAMMINAARSAGGRIIAVGTTAVRTLETVWDNNTGSVGHGTGWTNLFIRPGYKFRAVDALLTNFHLPRSTLLMLVCAFAGRETILSAYEEAKREGYRFYSYGDCMFIH
ncbi:MAG TPA: tRNA preQ1(34) S-adenosylmethionine ribosyltransferase-isomerase QueA [Acidobacteriota bacterium]|nr:tRNA preQ1(34) S-adenosylmethionine ribosyltransferase-isomerase QueA [Acidobacteriota bacterium]